MLLSNIFPVLICIEERFSERKRPGVKNIDTLKVGNGFQMRGWGRKDERSCWGEEFCGEVTGEKEDREKKAG